MASMLAGSRTGLWVWNGTSATDLVSGLDPTGLTLYNGVVLFSGLDVSGHAELWDWDGTAVHELSSGIGATTGLAPFDLTAVSITTPPPPTNFSVLDTTTNTPFQTNGTPYSGPVAGLQWEFIDANNGQPQRHRKRAKRLHPYRLRRGRNQRQPRQREQCAGRVYGIKLPRWEALVNDTFFVDDRSPSADIWSTVSNFHAGTPQLSLESPKAASTRRGSMARGRPDLQG